MRFSWNGAGAAGLGAIALVSGLDPAWAADDGRSPAEAAVLACRGVADPAQQLACFRKAGDALAAEIALNPTRGAAEREAAAPKPPKRPFGAPKARAARAERTKKKEDESLTVRVVSVSDRGDGRMMFQLDDGSTWVQTQSDEPLAGSVRAGDTVTLRRGLISGYVMDIPGRSFVRVARVGGE